MRRKALISVILSLLTATILTTIGCGGGGGGGAAWTPPPNPIGPGTGTATGTSTSTSTSTSTGTSTGTGTQTASQLITQGWADMGTGNWSTAISHFQAVLTSPTATPAERDQANNGLGWAYARTSGLETGIPYFTPASVNVGESKVGLAAALIHRSQYTDYAQAIALLEAEGIGTPSFVYAPPHPIGVSSAEAHALLAYAYFWRNNLGDDQLARDQITAARAADHSATTSVAQIYAVLQTMGLSGISGL